MTVRRATLDDALAIATIHVRAWQAAYQGIVAAAFLDSLSVEEREARWRKNLTEGASAMYVAEGPDGVIGWASVGGCRDPDATPTTAELWAIYVAPDRWHRGIGRALWARGGRTSRATASRRSSCGCWRTMGPRGGSTKPSGSAASPTRSRSSTSGARDCARSGCAARWEVIDMPAMSTWLPWALLSAVFAALTAIFAKVELVLLLALRR